MRGARPRVKGRRRGLRRRNEMTEEREPAPEPARSKSSFLPIDFTVRMKLEDIGDENGLDDPRSDRSVPWHGSVRLFRGSELT